MKPAPFVSFILTYLLQTRVEEFKTALERWQTKFAEAEEVITTILSQQWKILKSNSKVMKAMEGEREAIENEKDDLERQFEALKLMVEPYRYYLRFTVNVQKLRIFQHNHLIQGPT